MDLDDLMPEVEAAFARTADGLVGWDDPHPPPGRIVDDAEYSRVTNPARWRVIGARAEAWIEALVERGLAVVERDADPRWVEPPTTRVTRTDCVTPTVRGGLPLIVCRSRIEDVPDAGVTLGVGEPVVQVAVIPDCGCDACDSGSQDVIDVVDSYIRPVVSGEFRFLRRGDRSIMALEDGRREGRNIVLSDAGDRIPPGFRFLPVSRPATTATEDLSSSGLAPRPRVRTRDLMAEVLADPSGWDEVSGPSWLSGPPDDARH